MGKSNQVLAALGISNPRSQILQFEDPSFADPKSLRFSGQLIRRPVKRLGKFLHRLELHLAERLGFFGIL